jgi:hypothetical protein
MSHEKMISRNKDMYRELDLFIERIQCKDNYIVCKNELGMLKDIVSGIITNIVVFKMLNDEGISDLIKEM